MNARQELKLAAIVWCVIVMLTVGLGVPVATAVALTTAFVAVSYLAGILIP